MNRSLVQETKCSSVRWNIIPISFHGNDCASIVGERCAWLPSTTEATCWSRSSSELLGPRTKIVAMTHMSNVLGTVTPVHDLVSKAHAVGAKVLLDGAQAVAHLPVDVQQIGCDFYAFSGHKLYGPTGVGVLYGKRELLDSMPPYQSGWGNGRCGYLRSHELSGCTYAIRGGDAAHRRRGRARCRHRVPYVFGVGCGTAPRGRVDGLCSSGLSGSARSEAHRHVGNRASVISFALGQLHPSDVGTILDNQGVAIRAGHHCAQPLMQRLGVSATARASLGVYNNRADIDALVTGMHKVLELFQ